jgi:NAD(P)H-dependent FMN reductase
MALKTAVILGSVRTGRQGAKAGKFIENALKKRGWEIEMIDPKELDLPLINKIYADYPKGKAPKKLEKLAKIFRDTDAFVIVSPEYNHSIPPALSNLIDHFFDEYFWRPSGIVCYSTGDFGGVRAAMQLRVLLADVGMTSIPMLLPIPKIQEALDDNGVPKDKEAFERRVNKFLGQLEWYAKAMKEARKKGTPEI